VVTPRARAHRPQQPQTFPYHFLLAEGVWGKPPERLKGNFGVAKGSYYKYLLVMYN